MNMDLTQEKYKLSRYNVLHEDGDVHFMWNTYSNALLKLDKDDQKYIQSFYGVNDESKEFNLLKSQGFIVHNQINEFNRVCSQEKQGLLLRNAEEIKASILLGMTCNYHCHYCFEKAAITCSSKQLPQMTPEIADKITEYICQQLKNNQTVKKLKILWFGGEPLLYKSVLKHISRKIMAFTQHHNITYSGDIVTNGRFLDKNTLIELQELGVDEGQITLDGTQEVYCKSKGASSEDFDYVIENICQAAEKIALLIRLNIPDNDANEAIAITDYLYGHKNLLGKVRVYFAFVKDYSLPPSTARQAYVKFTQNYSHWLNHVIEHYGASNVAIRFPIRKSTSCGSIRERNFCIDSSGNLYKCERRFGDDTRITGDIWNGGYYNDTHLAYLSTVDSPLKNECSQCSYLPICMGGCANDFVVGYDGFDCDAYKRLQFKLKLLEGGYKLETAGGHKLETNYKS